MFLTYCEDLFLPTSTHPITQSPPPINQSIQSITTANNRLPILRVLSTLKYLPLRPFLQFSHDPERKRRFEAPNHSWDVYHVQRAHRLRGVLRRRTARVERQQIKSRKEAIKADAMSSCRVPSGRPRGTSAGRANSVGEKLTDSLFFCLSWQNL